MKQTLTLFNQCGLDYLKEQKEHSLVVVTDCPLEIEQRPIYNASRIYMIYGGVEYLVARRSPGEERIPGEKIVQPYFNILADMLPTTIVDPFMGTGTIGKAALMTGHSFVGVEINVQRYNLCVERLNAVFEGMQCDHT